MRQPKSRRLSTTQALLDTRTSQLTVRPARECDLVPLTFFVDAVLRKDYFLRRGQLASMLRDRRHEILIAELDGVLVGVAILTRGAPREPAGASGLSPALEWTLPGRARSRAHR